MKIFARRSLLVSFFSFACYFLLLARYFLFAACYLLLIACYFLLVARQEIAEDFFFLNFFLSKSKQKRSRKLNSETKSLISK